MNDPGYLVQEWTPSLTSSRVVALSEARRSWPDHLCRWWPTPVDHSQRRSNHLAAAVISFEVALTGGNSYSKPDNSSCGMVMYSRPGDTSPPFESSTSCFHTVNHSEGRTARAVTPHMYIGYSKVKRSQADRHCSGHSISCCHSL